MLDYPIVNALAVIGLCVFSYAFDWFNRKVK